MPMPAGAVQIKRLGGVPLYYERRSTADRWGDLGVNEQFSPYVLPQFGTRLDRAFHDLWPFVTQPNGIVSAGAYVDKPGEHGDAEAFDLDGLVWSDPGKYWLWVATSYETPVERRYYCGLMCHFMLYFGNVLGWEYNAAHHDHIHLDNAVSPGFRASSHAIVTTIQATLKYCWGIEVLVDGDWGPKTKTAFFTALGQPTQPAIFPSDLAYRAFLSTSRGKGLSVTAAATPTKLDEVEQHLKDMEANLAALRKEFDAYKGGLA